LAHKSQQKNYKNKNRLPTADEKGAKKKKKGAKKTNAMCGNATPLKIK